MIQMLSLEIGKIVEKRHEVIKKSKTKRQSQILREIKEKINSETGEVIETNPNGINEHDAATWAVINANLSKHESYVVNDDIVKRADIKVDFIWDILHARGKNVKALNVPFVVPPYSFNVDYEVERPQDVFFAIEKEIV